MKQAKAVLIAAVLAMSALTPLDGLAQSSTDQGALQTSDGAALSDGEVRKIDKAAGKITIKHGPIKHLDMPPMTMVFTAKDRALLDKANVGDKIRFMVVDDGGKMVVTDIQPAR